MNETTAKTQTIWKYTLQVKDSQTLPMPDGAQILTVQVQGGMPRLWALVEPGDHNEARVINIFGTGQPIPNGARNYIGTFQMNGGLLVFHVFEAL